MLDSDCTVAADDDDGTGAPAFTASVTGTPPPAAAAAAAVVRVSPGLLTVTVTATRKGSAPRSRCLQPWLVSQALPGSVHVTASRLVMPP
jgi:hypothetical protein